MIKFLLGTVFILFFCCSYGQSEKNDWTLVPGVRVGPITTKTCEKDLEKIFGFTNVYRDSRNIGAEFGEESQNLIVTYVFKDTKNELCVFWTDNTYTKVSSVECRKENSNWHLEGGLRVGSTIEELKKYNQGEFYFFAFGWDYGGVIISDNLQGKLKKYEDILNIGLDGNDITKDSRFSGDGKKISSNTKNLFELTKAKVISISVTLKENYYQPKPVETNNLAKYDMFGKVVKISQESMYSFITIKIEKNNYFNYYADYDKSYGKYVKRKIINSFNFTISLCTGRNCLSPTKLEPLNFWDLIKEGTNVGVNFFEGYLKTQADDYTLIQQGAGWNRAAVNVEIFK